MPISDSQYNQCCDYLDELFAGLIIKRHWENKEYTFTVHSTLMGERLFSSFKPLFQSTSYLDETISIQFNFNNLPDNSPLLTQAGLEAVYREIPRKFARYIAAEIPEVSVYEREHFQQCLEQAVVQLPGTRIEDLKWLIQQSLDKYQRIFEQVSSYKEKNAALLKMNHLYKVTRNANKLTQLVQEKERKATPEKIKPPLEVASPRLFLKKEQVVNKKEIIIESPHIKSGAISLSSLFGILVGFALLSWIIYTDSDSYRIFLNLNSFLFVLGATMACTMISFHGLYILRAFKEILQIFIPTHVSPSLLLNDVETLIKWSQKFKVHHQEKRPFRQLEELFSNYKDPDAAFMKTAIAYLLENYKSEKLKSILNNLVDTMFTRSQVQVRIIRTMGNIASVFGALGSLMSMIMALSHPYSATSQLLNALAASLVPMLYGFVLAYLIFKPAARKLEQKNEMRRFRNQLLSCGFVLLSENSSALEIEDTLNSFLDPQRNFHIVARS